LNLSRTLLIAIILIISFQSKAQNLIGNCYTKAGYPYGLMVTHQDTNEFKGQVEYSYSVMIVMMDYDSEGKDKFLNGQIMKIKDKDHLGLPMTYFITVNVPDPECMNKLIDNLTYQFKLAITFGGAKNCMGDGNLWNCNDIQESLDRSNDAIKSKDWGLEDLKDYLK
jgi:hypothetical protein